MTLKKLIKLVDAHYPDGLVLECFKNDGDNCGDTLAQFLAIELKETFDEAAEDHEQLDTACSKVESAIEELTGVHQALVSAHRKSLRRLASKQKKGAATGQ